MSCVVFKTINNNRSTEIIVCIDLYRDNEGEQWQFCTSEDSKFSFCCCNQLALSFIIKIFFFHYIVCTMYCFKQIYTHLKDVLKLIVSDWLPFFYWLCTISIKTLAFCPTLFYVMPIYLGLVILVKRLAHFMTNELNSGSRFLNAAIWGQHLSPWRRFSVVICLGGGVLLHRVESVPLQQCL